MNPLSSMNGLNISYNLQELRARLLNSLLKYASSISSVLYFFALVPALGKGFTYLIFIYTAFYLWLLTITFINLIGYLFRTLSLLFFLYSLGLVNLFLNGLNIDAGLFLLAFTTMSGLLIGLHAGLGALLLSCLTISILGYYTVSGILVPGMLLPQQDPMLWIIGGIIFLLIGTLLTISLKMLISGLDFKLIKTIEDVEILDQTTGSLQKAKNELQAKVEERTLYLKKSEQSLEHANHLLLLLSQAAQVVQRARTPDEVYQVIQMQMDQLKFILTVFKIKKDDQSLSIAFTSVKPNLLSQVEKLTGLSVQNYSFPLRDGSIYHKVITEEETFYLEDSSQLMADTLPKNISSLARPIINIIKFAQCIISPLMVSGKPFGMLVINGPGLSMVDLPAINTFSNQIAITLENIKLLQETQAQVDERSVLLREIHHRVKNNLQIINSLLNLQFNNLNGMQAADVLRETNGRVQAMALVHEKLYQSDNLSRIDFSAYLHSLANYLLQAYATQPEKIQMKIETDPVTFDLDTAIPCGLIVNELVANALKYAFPDLASARENEINITLRCIEEQNKYTLTVSDNGIGLPENMDPHSEATLGLQLVRMLTDQLDGQLEISCLAGTEFRITFPEILLTK